MLVVTTTLQIRITIEELNKIIAYAEAKGIYDTRTNSPNKSEAVRKLIEIALKVTELQAQNTEDPKLFQKKVDELTAERDMDHENKWLQTLSYEKLRFIIEKATERKEAIYEEDTKHYNNR